MKYEYDAANRIQVVRRDDAGQTMLQAFQYGATNARLIDYDPSAGVNRFYAAVGGTVLSEYTEYQSLVFTWTKSYTYLGESQLATITPNGAGGETVEYNHPDRLGTRIITNQQTGSVSEQATLPFGRPLDAESTVTNNNKRFTSYERSAPTGLDYAINRTYDSKQGRFTQVDPIGMQAVSLAAPQTLNMYSYCGNDPVNRVDSNGLFFGKLFRWIGKIFKTVMKILKWVVIVIALVLVTALILAYTPYMLPGWLGNAMGSLLRFLSSIGASAFGATLAGAIGVEVGSTVGSIITAGLAGVGAIASNYADKKRKILSGETLKKYITVVGSILKVLKDSKSACHKFLKDKGFDPKKIADKLRKNTPYDIATSTNSASDINPLFDQYTIKDLFSGPNAPLSGARAATSLSGRNVYYDASGIRASTMIHETAHQTNGITDPDLAKKIGVSDEAYQKEYGIDDALEKGGCK